MRAAGLQTLYLRRYLLNGQELLDWAAANGAGGEPARAAHMHVTLVYSRRPLDWRRVEPDPHGLTIEPGAARRVERLPNDATALVIDAPDLVARHKALIRLGASGGFHPYRPHVTFAAGHDIRPPAGKPFAGALHFGPEVMSPAPVRGSDV